LGPDLHGIVGRRILESLKVGIDSQKFDSGQSSSDHATNCVPSGATDSSYFDIS